MFKEKPLEFLQTEMDALAAEIGKLAHEVEFTITEEVRDGVIGRVLGIKSDAPVAQTPAPEAEAPAAPKAETPTK